MIIFSKVSKSYGKKTLFQDLSLNINAGEKIGLIGPNGSGKSTLFYMVLKELEPSSGEIQIAKNIRIGYLPQESHFISVHTVLSELTEGDEGIVRLKKEKEDLERDGQAASEHYGQILHELETLGYFELEYKAKKILMGLGFKEADFTRPINQMSGGWQMRVLLGKLLTCHYDILLLDEPTNYLDLNAALWLKDYLCGFRGTFIMISHDRAFLNEVTNYTLILENGSIFKVRGNFEHYERIKAEKRIHLLKQYKEQEKKREQLEKFISRFHAQPNKASSVRAKRTTLEKMQENEIVLPSEPGESIGNFHFPNTRPSGYRAMRLEKIAKSYGQIKVYENFDFEINQNEKAVLVGENGAGKSTLLKILAGVVDIDSGSRIAGHNVEVGYFSQTRMDVLSPENSVLQEAYSAASGYMSEENVRTILGVFLFSGDDSYKKVKVLSGGEKSRLILAKLLINPPNFLLLDEPTTHLDVDAVDALIRALSEYSGTLAFISHDIHFVRSVANTVYEVKDGSVRKFPSSFDYYLEKKAKGEDFSPQVKPKGRDIHQEKLEEAKRKAKEEEKARKEQDKKRKSHNKELGEKITKLRNEKERLKLESYAKARALSRPHFYRDEDAARAYGQRIKEIEKKTVLIDREIKEFEKQII
ncbi:MAG: ATP-binding cassette domain-containing protein [Candidatus Omnitrophota bacterium]